MGDEEGREIKGNQNPPNTSNWRPPKPGGSRPMHYAESDVSAQYQRNNAIVCAVWVLAGERASGFEITQSLNWFWSAHLANNLWFEVAIKYMDDHVQLRAPRSNWTIQVDYDNPSFARVVAGRIIEILELK